MVNLRKTTLLYIVAISLGLLTLTSCGLKSDLYYPKDKSIIDEEVSSNDKAQDDKAITEPSKQEELSE